MKQRVVALAIAAVVCGRVQAQDVSPIIHEGIVEAPLEQVWTAFTTGEGLRSWLAPHADIDLRVGGRTTARKDNSVILKPSRTLSSHLSHSE